MAFRKDTQGAALVDVWPKFVRKPFYDGFSYTDFQPVIQLMKTGATLKSYYHTGMVLDLPFSLSEAEIISFFKIGFTAYWEYKPKSISGLSI